MILQIITKIPGLNQATNFAPLHYGINEDFWGEGIDMALLM